MHELLKMELKQKRYECLKLNRMLDFIDAVWKGTECACASVRLTSTSQPILLLRPLISMTPSSRLTLWFPPFLPRFLLLLLLHNSPCLVCSRRPHTAPCGIIVSHTTTRSLEVSCATTCGPWVSSTSTHGCGVPHTPKHDHDIPVPPQAAPESLALQYVASSSRASPGATLNPQSHTLQRVATTLSIEAASLLHFMDPCMSTIDVVGPMHRLPHKDSPVYHSVVLHQYPRHVHPMVTRWIVGILWHVDCWFSSCPPLRCFSSSCPPSVVHSPNLTSGVPWRWSTRPCRRTIPKTWWHAPLALMWSPGNGSSCRSWRWMTP